MKRLLLSFGILAYTVGVFGLVFSCAGPQVRTNGVVNLVQVRPDVYRSGQPVGDEWGTLAALGVRHAIKLNFPEEGSDNDAARFGIEVIPVPIQPSTKGIDIFARPSPEAMSELARLAERIRAAGGTEGAWLIHCKNGHDRTGMVVGLIRMVVDGWTPKQAWAEMLERGYHPELPGLTWAFHELAEGKR